jgi:hypothetical protein
MHVVVEFSDGRIDRNHHGLRTQIDDHDAYIYSLGRRLRSRQPPP